jgi:hypothetical protein
MVRNTGGQVTVVVCQWLRNGQRRRAEGIGERRVIWTLFE